MALLSFLDKSRAVAPPGYNRWLVPPAALAIHLAIGQAYAFSVFTIPMSKIVQTRTGQTGQDWTHEQLAWIFSIAIAFLGISAAVFGKWLEDNGPRKAMFFAACCFGGGFIVSALGIWLHQLWIVYLGYGVLGGIGLGLGYISPVSTLVKWFIDRPGMATGLAIMGFGGGAMIGAPLATTLMGAFAGPHSIGLVQTLLVMGVLYFCFMMFGVFMIRTPPPDWKPAGYVPVASASGMITQQTLGVGPAVRTFQFWLLWIVLCTNVTAGIGVLEQASPMIQEMFKGRVNAASAAGFVGLLSLFNMAGRFFWSSVSDYIGRKATYVIFFALGVAAYIALPFSGSLGVGNLPLFVGISALILSMYGGGFATIPAYLRDMFGVGNVSAIHGRLLTAWSVAGILGPVLVNRLRTIQLERGVPVENVYSTVLFVMAGLLLVGFIANLAVRPVRKEVFDQAQMPGARPSAQRSPA
jgi:MFS family permease